MAGQVWLTNNLGGFMYSDQLSKELRMALQPVVKFRQLCDVKDATHQGLHKGATFYWNVYDDVATQGTSLVETNTMPETNFTITQSSMTINEFGNSVPYTGKLDDLSLHPVREIIRKVLKNDAKKAFDIEAATQFGNTLLSVVGTGTAADNAGIAITTTGTATATNTLAMLKEHVKLVIDEMKERNIPPYENDDYYCISWPSTFRTFKDNLESIKQYTDSGYTHIMNGECGRYEGCRFVEQTHIPKAASYMSTDGGSWTNGVSTWAVFCGEDTVAEAIAVPEEIRGKIPTDFGRSRGVAWYYMGGFGIVHNATGATNNRVVLWDSAA